MVRLCKRAVAALLVSGCSGSPFVIGTDAGLPEEVASTTTRVPRAIGEGDAGGTRDADGGEGGEDADVARVDGGGGGGGGAAVEMIDAKPEAGTDATVDSSDAEMAPDLGFECLPAPPTICGCGGGTGPSGGNAFTYPAEFCMFPADFSVIMTTPLACQCAGHYTCECVTATNPCATTGQKFVNCQVGTTGGVVVTCK